MSGQRRRDRDGDRKRKTLSFQSNGWETNAAEPYVHTPHASMNKSHFVFLFFFSFRQIGLLWPPHSIHFVLCERELVPIIVREIYIWILVKAVHCVPRRQTALPTPHEKCMEMHVHGKWQIEINGCSWLRACVCVCVCSGRPLKCQSIHRIEKWKITAHTTLEIGILTPSAGCRSVQTRESVLSDQCIFNFHMIRLYNWLRQITADEIKRLSASAVYALLFDNCARRRCCCRVASKALINRIRWYSNGWLYV